MQQARWGRKEITYTFIQMEADIPTHFGVAILETAQAWSGANRYQKELIATSNRPSTSPSFAAGHLSQRLLMCYANLIQAQRLEVLNSSTRLYK